ncbi:MAG TPA: 16S rRNA (guanine(527)-N(7))-methyltransferase RsmG [Hyphomicrobiaceae bacterium]|nr:16S rRNA (guanine(527)-N(7))-methyltransferase RsmG [Hyphomicrobiaceae bacterium]
MAIKPHPTYAGAMASEIRQIATSADFAAAFDVSRETIERLEVYEALLRQWQKAVNLVAPSTLDAVWHRHFADSAQIVRLAPAGARSWVDLGSGAGFPGLVVAILLAETGARITLIESDSRKCAFLREVARKTGITVDILSTRIEQATTQAKVEPPEVVSARALAPLDRLLGLAAPLFTPSTVGVFLKGRDAALEVETAAKAWTFAVEMVPSITETTGRVVVIRDLQPKSKD